MHYIVRCPVPDEVAKKQLDLAKAIRANPQKGVHVDRMLDATLVMADELLQFFFMRPLETVHVGAMTKGAVSMGIRTGMSIISKLGKRAFAGMDRDHLLLFADYLDSLISSEE
jgi:hypothetical protein